MPRSSDGSRSYSPPTTAYPRYTTYTSEELQSTFARFSHIGTSNSVEGSHQNGANPAKRGRGSRLIKSHECCVVYPDGTTGTCRYTRGGPAWHVFAFDHQGQQMSQLHKTQLPTRHCTERVANTIAGIEAKALELAQAAFVQAVERELNERFRRASAPVGYNRYNNGNRPTNPLTLPQMSVKRAKDLSGKYALCVRLGNNEGQRLLPCISFVYDTFDEANDAWRKSEHRTRRFVACLCRYSRQWELPLYNSLHADKEYATMLGFNNEPTEPEVSDTDNVEYVIDEMEEVE